MADSTGGADDAGNVDGAGNPAAAVDNGTVPVRLLLLHKTNHPLVPPVAPACQIAPQIALQTVHQIALRCLQADCSP